MFFLALALFLFFSKFEKINEAQPMDIIGFSLLTLFSVGTFIFLFFNHLPLARQTELIIEGKQLTIVREGEEEHIHFSEITCHTAASFGERNKNGNCPSPTMTRQMQMAKA